MDAFIGEIRMMGFGVVPKGWLACQGQLLPIAQNQALFSLLGTTYGGNGVQTFGLPDLRGRAILGVGQGPGLSNTVQGQVGGTASVTLQPAEMPVHIHTVTGTLQGASGPDTNSPINAYPALPDDGGAPFSTGTPNANLAAASVTGTAANAGGSQPHENRQPLMAMNYCIAVQGYFPSRN
ncbi:microcystin-dependent protein [Hymenobacter sp. UYAg731]